MGPNRTKFLPREKEDMVINTNSTTVYLMLQPYELSGEFLN